MQSNKLLELLNKMDFNLKEVFENVDIKQLDNQKELTFEVKLSKFKSDSNNRAELVFQISESTIYENSMIWKYKTNPLNENSIYITRTSTLNSIAMDMSAIILESRFDKEYLTTLAGSINESVDIIDEVSDETMVGDFEFDLDEVVSIDDIDGVVTDREKITVEKVNYNVYQVNIDGARKSVFEYDLKKK